VITDIHMPNMGGIELVESLRDLPAYRFRPLLVLTTDGSTEMKERGRAAGATGWILKPVKPETLIRTTERVLGAAVA
jgi:Response regulator containing CheY-like receiver domain and AraC-type DNA-binding domain